MMLVRNCCIGARGSVAVLKSLESLVDWQARCRETTERYTHLSLTELKIYTDGACSPNPGPGGWGAVIIDGVGGVTERSGSSTASTNNRMELTAAVEALKSLEQPGKIVLYTDSQYLKKGVTEWIQLWQQNNWRTAAKKEVKNVDLWQQLIEQLRRHEIVWKWVRGHAGNYWNSRADELAVAARQSVESAAVTEMGVPAGPAENHIELFTGVTCRHSTGVGGWAVILSWRDHVRVLGARSEELTANQLYLQAVISGLKSLKKALPVHVHTHSGYIYEGATSWLAGWQQRQWRTRDGKEVSNKSLWQELAGLMSRYEVRFFLEDRDQPRCFVQEAKELAKEFAQGG
jgi:ribonuclease HI